MIALKRHAAAEITAMLACMRLGAVFIPLEVDLETLASDFETLSLKYFNHIQSIIANASPIAVICVADSDTDMLVRLVATAGLHRCVMVAGDGTLLHEERLEVADEFEQASFRAASEEGEGEEGEAMYILYTSGSTGQSVV